MVTSTRSPKADLPAGGNRLQQYRTLLLLVGGLVVLGAVGIGYLLMSAPEDSAPSDVTTAPRRTATAGGGGTATATTSAVSSTTPAGTAVTVGPPGRDPFAAAGHSTTGPGGGTDASDGTDATGSTETPTAPPAGPSAPSTTTMTRTLTTTTTATASNLFLGLYAWNGAVPTFLVNETAYTPGVGSSFATSFVYVGQFTSGTATCANVTYLGAARSLCPGQVLKLR